MKINHIQKLIKLNEQHYIIVDDSEIQNLQYKDWFYDIKTKSVGQYFQGDINGNYKKITHLTQPLNKNFNDWFDVLIISLSEVEELINGYSVDKMANNLKVKKESMFGNSFEFDLKISQGFILGFKEHQELAKDKLFTADDMIKFAIDCYNDNYGTDMSFDERAKINIQSLIPKTEWDVEFDEQGKLKLV